ncbi:MAG: cation transporter [Candidatus Rokubacteria bacterium]|nr:cation transporter [Candidatus Rokubacteria bacterium]
MKACCDVGEVQDRQRRVLTTVLAINGAMFVGEFAAALLAHSTALLADSVDMLGDTIVYGVSLSVVARGPAWKARVALLKGVIMAAFGVGVLGEAIAKLLTGVVPGAGLMGGVGVVALAANGVCALLLWRRQRDDLNMRSAWLCSRNDVAANIGVLLAAGGVTLTGSAWPDIVTGLAIAGMFGSAAMDVIRDAWRELRPVGCH